MRCIEHPHVRAERRQPAQRPPFRAVTMDHVERPEFPHITTDKPDRGEVAGMNTRVHGIAGPLDRRNRPNGHEVRSGYPLQVAAAVSIRVVPASSFRSTTSGVCPCGQASSRSRKKESTRPDEWIKWTSQPRSKSPSDRSRTWRPCHPRTTRRPSARG